jgi:hypothetical protein
VIDVFRRGAAGRSAERRYEELYKSWLRRRFGRRMPLLVGAVFTVLAIVVVKSHLSTSWAFYAGFVIGGGFVAWMLLPQLLMPRQIFYWQMGAWGEQKTASELKRLTKQGWTIRHDAAWGERANHDHIVVGSPVFLVNSRNTPDSVVTIENRVLRVTSIDVPDDSYVADRWIPGVENEARAFKRRLDRELGFPVAVYPVIALWASFERKQQYLGDVSVVEGLHLVEWLRSRPADLLNDQKRRQVERYVRSLPSAIRRRQKNRRWAISDWPRRFRSASSIADDRRH